MKSFKKTKEKYDNLKKKIGIDKIAEIHNFIQKKDKKGLIEFSRDLPKKLKEDSLLIAKYL